MFCMGGLCWGVNWNGYGELGCSWVVGEEDVEVFFRDDDGNNLCYFDVSMGGRDDVLLFSEYGGGLGLWWWWWFFVVDIFWVGRFWLFSFMLGIGVDYGKDN